jgi:uncharacterized protein YgiM (DUF1202 family)
MSTLPRPSCIVVVALILLMAVATTIPTFAQSCSSSVSGSVSVSAGAGAGTSVSASGSASCVNGVPQDASTSITVTGDSTNVSGQVNATSSGSNGETLTSSDSVGSTGNTGTSGVNAESSVQISVVRIVNLRSTPGISRNILTQIDRGGSFQIIGRNANGAWLQIVVGETTGWVCSRFVQYAGNVSDLPVTDSSSATCRR